MVWGMSLQLAHITLDSAQPLVLAQFWSAVLDRPVDERASEFFASIDDQTTERPSWFFVGVPEAKATKNRVHVDLAADDREAEVARLVALGATQLADHEQWGAVWTVLADPEGNEFCVGQRPQ